MTAQLTDNFMQVAAEGAITYMTGSGKNVGATTFTINNATGWPTTTGFIVAVRQVTAAGIEVAGTYCEYIATLSGTTLTINPTPVIGNDQQYTAASTTQCFVPVSSTRDNKLVNAILTQHNQNGTHQAISNTGGMTTDTLAISGANGISGAGYTNANLANPSKFSVSNGGQTMPGGFVFTKVQLNSVTFDTGSNFDHTTNFRFVAPQAGFYFFSAQTLWYISNGIIAGVSLYKNGSPVRTGPQVANNTGTSFNGIGMTTTLFISLAANDYIELFVAQNAGGNQSLSSANLDGFLVSKT